MQLFIINQANPYHKPGTILRKFQEGFQPCRTSVERGKLKIHGTYGVLLPHDVLDKYCLPIRRKS